MSLESFGYSSKGIIPSLLKLCSSRQVVVFYTALKKGYLARLE
jgi:hypothetical protein